MGVKAFGLGKCDCRRSERAKLPGIQGAAPTSV